MKRHEKEGKSRGRGTTITITITTITPFLVGRPPLGNGFPALGFVAAQGWEKRRPSTQVLWERSDIPNLVVYLKLVSVVSKYRYTSEIGVGA